MSHRSSAQKPCNSAMSLTCVARFQPGWVLIVHAPFDSARTYRPCLQATDGRRCRWSSGCARDPTAAAHKPHPTRLGEGRSHGCDGTCAALPSAQSSSRVAGRDRLPSHTALAIQPGRPTSSRRHSRAKLLYIHERGSSHREPWPVSRHAPRTGSATWPERRCYLREVRCRLRRRKSGCLHGEVPEPARFAFRSPGEDTTADDPSTVCTHPAEIELRPARTREVGA